MMILYTCRAMPYSVIIKGPFSCCTYEQIKRNTARQYTERDFESHNYKWNVGIKSSPSVLTEPHRRGGRKSIGQEGTKESKRTIPSKTDKRNQYEFRKTAANTHRVYMVLHQTLCIYILAFTLVLFGELLNVSLILVLVLGALFLLQVFLVQP